MQHDHVTDESVSSWEPLSVASERGAAGPIVLLTLVFKKERKTWVGKCRELGTATFDRSLEAVRRELVELVTLHLNTIEKSGQRERVFSERGITLRHDLPSNIKLSHDAVEGEYVQPFGARQAA